MNRNARDWKYFCEVFVHLHTTDRELFHSQIWNQLILLFTTSLFGRSQCFVSAVDKSCWSKETTTEGIRSWRNQRDKYDPEYHPHKAYYRNPIKCVFRQGRAKAPDIVNLAFITIAPAINRSAFRKFPHFILNSIACIKIRGLSIPFSPFNPCLY